MKGSERLSKIFGEVADAIRAKKGTNELIKPEDFSAEISSIGAGSTDDTDSTSKGAVTFYDYDGVVLHSYTKDEFLSLSAMPNLPEREGLICQEWNWSFADAVAYVQEYGTLNIGATYITDDGKTRLYITIATKGRMDVPLCFTQTVANGVVIDWGDGSATQTVSGTGKMNTTHKYAELGDYVITLNPVEGCTLGLGHNSSPYTVMGSTSGVGIAYCNMLRKVEIGRGVTIIGERAFYNCHSFESVVIPNSVTSIGNLAFGGCYYLASVVIPEGVTSIGSNAFSSCHYLASVVIPNSVTSIGDGPFSSCSTLASVVIPDSVTSIGRTAFSGCYSLTSVVIPNSVTSIGISAFSDCSALASVVIPESVTNIGNSAFSYCSTLASIVIPDSVMSIGETMFYYCYSLTSVVIPEGVTNIGNTMFNNCYSLTSVVIPEGVTSIGNSAFYYCQSLTSIEIPSSVTSIGSSTFSSCSAVAFYDFSTHTAVPTLSATNAFSSIASDCKIIVPDALYDTWKSATNWSTYASKIIKKTDWDASQA